MQTNCELFDVLFGHILEDPTEEIESKINDSMELIRSCAVEKNIEFDGYYKKRWADSADTIINFDEDYFDDPDKTKLYVYLAGMVDADIFGFLNQVHLVFFQREISRDFLQSEIENLTKIKGIRF